MQACIVKAGCTDSNTSWALCWHTLMNQVQGLGFIAGIIATVASPSALPQVEQADP